MAHTYSFYLFSYGSNGVEQLSDRLNVTNSLISENAKPYKLLNYRREFFGASTSWNGATATLTKKTGSFVTGLILLISGKNNKFYIGDQLIDYANLLNKEAFPKKYMIEKIGCENNIDVLAFVKNINFVQQTKKVTEEYIVAIAKTLCTRRKLLEQKLSDPYIIDVNYVEQIFTASQYKTTLHENGTLKEIIMG